jgi:hypothetical protein
MLYKKILESGILSANDEGTINYYFLIGLEYFFLGGKGVVKISLLPLADAGV